MNQEKIEKIMKSLEAGYDAMAGKFSETRKYFWRGFDFIPKSIHDGEKVLDFGCGNGRILEVLNDRQIEYHGVDISGRLVDIAGKKYSGENIHFHKISSLDSLPFPDDFFNKVVSVSVFHHFPKKYAEGTARELYRVTKPGGEAIVSVWNLWQKKYRRHIFSLSGIFKKICHLGKFSGLGFFDVFIPFRDNRGDVFDRYHLAFTEKSLTVIFRQAGFDVSRVFVLDERNIILIAKK